MPTQLEKALVARDVPIPIYLDQNVFSALQRGRVERDGILKILKSLQSLGCVLVYSKVHVDECRDSDQPAVFADIIEDTSACLLEYSNAADTGITLTSNRAAELILAELDVVYAAERCMQNLLKPIQFAQGWLGEVEAQELEQELISDFNLFWEMIERDIPQMVLGLLTKKKDKSIQYIRDIPFHNIKDESQEWQNRFRKRLPENYAQLDEMPSDAVVEFLMSRLDKNGQREIRSSYPPKFWAKIENREEGHLSSFALMLFMMGLTRDPRVKRKSRECREKHFLGQYRDCLHIEQASRCLGFITLDKGASRLAESVYAYAGVKTYVMPLGHRKN